MSSSIPLKGKIESHKLRANEIIVTSSDGVNNVSIMTVDSNNSLKITTSITLIDGNGDSHVLTANKLKQLLDLVI